jgi:hypothetical protein
VFSTEELISFGTDRGASSLGLEDWPGIAVDAARPSLSGVAADDVVGALVSSCSGEAVVTDP